jgi:hypothetical protein
LRVFKTLSETAAVRKPSICPVVILEGC